MKYRLLTIEELNELQPEFLEFLAANSVTSKDWERLKADEPPKAMRLIELFSDVVLDKVLEKINYIEHREEKEWRVFHCQEEAISLIGLSAKTDSPLDFRNSIEASELIKHVNQVYSAEKAYTQERKPEIFNMLQHGAQICKADLYHFFELLLDKQ